MSDTIIGVSIEELILVRISMYRHNYRYFIEELISTLVPYEIKNKLLTADFVVSC